ncbi:hypothetical protein SLE2022_067930 [Rubroshorea leprosula]
MCLNRTWKIAGHGTMTKMESILLSQYKVLCQENATQDKEKYKLILDKRIPLKLSTFAWKALRDRLPTKLKLAKKGVQLDTNNCPLCGEQDENADHRSFSCKATWM